MLGDRIGCGEVKVRYQALNHRLVDIDLARVATLTKDASDKHKLKSTLAFLVIGKISASHVLRSMCLCNSLWVRAGFNNNIEERASKCCTCSSTVIAMPCCMLLFTSCLKL